MQLRDLALRIVRSADLDAKLSWPATPMVDDAPGLPLRFDRPGRAPALEIRRVHDAPVPSIEGMHDRAQRVRIIHAFANHELQASELFAWALLAFPDAPAEFRAGLARILRDEQRHTKLYLARLAEHDAALGDYPVSGYFWNKTPSILAPADFVAAMSLTFENANLDHTIAYARAARRAGDERTAAVIDAVHRDEIEHVRFGWLWLGRFKDAGESMADAYRARLIWPLRPALARGAEFDRAGREAAGMDGDFIDMIEAGDERSARAAESSE